MCISGLKILVVEQSSSLPAVLATVFYIPRHKMPYKNTSGSKQLEILSSLCNT